MRYEVAIKILDENYVDNLIIALVRQGYDVYYNSDENIVCFTTDKEELTQINYERIK